MPRPRQTPEQNRCYSIRIRLTDAEKEQLQSTADSLGLNLSDFVRVKTLSVMPRHRKPTPERAALLRGLAELGKIGSNANQIARALNRKFDEGDKTMTIDLDQIRHAIHGVDMLTHHLLKILENGH